ncbi:ribonuclease H-like domain, reverse transcriptase, RNA-dependent DNA polymerase [Tanacetum coccineum]
MMKATNMPQNVWAEAVRHAIYILNSVPTKALEDITPHAAIKQRKSNLENLRIFSCIAYAKVPSQHLTKLDDRSIKMVYLGNEQGSKAYCLFDPTTQRVCVSRDVKFKENETWDWKDYIGEHTNDEPEWTNFNIGDPEVTQTNGDISIKQSAYASKILEEAGMIDCNETLIPMDPGTRLTKITEGTMVNSTEYQSLIGCLRYLLHTRPDLSYSEQRIMGSPTSITEETRYMDTATAATTQALWLKRLLSKLTHTQEEMITIQVDNKSAIALLKNPVFHGRSKHIDTKYHFIRECVEREDIQVEFVSGEYQKADILTKALPKIKFLTMRQLIGLKDLSHSAYD